MSHGHDKPLPNTDLPPIAGLGPLIIGAAIAGVVGLLLTLLGGLSQPRQALLAYLVAFVFWLGISIGGITLVMANHAAGAKWNVSMRRFGESMGAVLPLFIALFLPLLFGAKHIWFWVDPPPNLPEEMVKHLEHKRSYLNMSSFTLRAVGYFLIWAGLSWLLRGASLAQDRDGDPRHTMRMRAWSAPGLVFFALTFTFASFDWLMSLQPTWYSTIFGLYVYAGAFLGSLAVQCLIVTGVRSSGSPLGAVISVDQQHNMGKLLLAFTAFWAYMAFSQYMLIWAGNLPEELQWIIVRSRGPWRPVGQLILVGQFLVPFFLLLSRDLKRSPPALAAVSVWVLFIHYVDTYWVVMPAADLARLGLHWTHLTAFVGIGGVSIAACAALLRSARPVPVRDPFLEDSLRYAQP
ncbi:MAG TPA: hypothetical protein VLW85_24065 [Myxococcales bacterium]|nr:hypothetical protein [Myxococcales bacterium]